MTFLKNDADREPPVEGGFFIAFDASEVIGHIGLKGLRTYLIQP